MNEGYFIGLHDKTTCGGKVLDGDTGVMMYGIAHAREGDRVTCGKDGETYQNRRWHFAHHQSWQSRGGHAGQLQQLPL